MKVLITGVDGFVAPYLAKLYLNKANVHCTYLHKPENKLKNIQYHHMDVENKDSVSKVISEIKPDLVFHLAGFSSVGLSWKNPKKVMSINAQGTKNILDVIVELKLKPKILVVSSSEIYGNPEKLPITENHPLKPESPYAESRLEQEKIIAEFKDLDIVIARSFNHTGPGQNPMFVFPSFVKQVVIVEKGLQEPVIMHGNLNVERDFCDVRDVVKAYKLLIEKGRPHEVYNVCSGKLYSLNELLDMLIEISGKDIKKRVDPKRVRPVDVLKLLGDNSKIMKETGWKPEIELKQTLYDMLEYFRKKINA